MKKPKIYRFIKNSRLLASIKYIAQHHMHFDYTTSDPKYKTQLTFFERLRLRNKLLNYDIFDIFLDYQLVYT